MKLVTFEPRGARTSRLGALQGDWIVDLAAVEPELPTSLLELIRQGPRLLRVAAEAAASGRDRIAAAEARLLAPIPRPARNIFCVGKNYFEHAEEFHRSGFDASAGKAAVPEYPIIFTKASNSVGGPGDPIPAYLDPTHSVDYEGELAVIIGTGGRGISREQAMAHVFGYTIVNDVTSRTLQNRHRQWFLGKSIDGFCPMGPSVVTADEIENPARLRLETRVNGELRQDAAVSQLIFDVPTLIETLSATITLEPGDIIATGTCAGVGIGFDPPKFLRAGDRVAVTIEPIGILSNEVA
jgi:2-keto-4-pentenoate hydratase/2-oxohepta-3-ene-1,7-dioic acid hydratase in catechol pathway